MGGFPKASMLSPWTTACSKRPSKRSKAPIVIIDPARRDDLSLGRRPPVTSSNDWRARCRTFKIALDKRAVETIESAAVIRTNGLTHLLVGLVVLSVLATAGLAFYY